MVEGARSILTIVPVRGIITLLALTAVVLFVLGCNDSSSTTTSRPMFPVRMVTHRPSSSSPRGPLVPLNPLMDLRIPSY